MAQSSDAANRKQRAEIEERDARRRMKNDRNSGKPVKGKDVGDMAQAAYRRGRAEQELAVENDKRRSGKKK